MNPAASPATVVTGDEQLCYELRQRGRVLFLCMGLSAALGAALGAFLTRRSL